MSETDWSGSADAFRRALASIAEDFSAKVRARHEREDDVDHDFAEAFQQVIVESMINVEDPAWRAKFVDAKHFRDSILRIV